MDMFAKKCWPGTLILLFVGLIGAFMVFCILGFFIDPSMVQDTRQGVVMAWGCFSMVYIAFVILGRHG